MLKKLTLILLFLHLFPVSRADAYERKIIDCKNGKQLLGVYQEGEVIRILQGYKSESLKVFKASNHYYAKRSVNNPYIKIPKVFEVYRSNAPVNGEYKYLIMFHDRVSATFSAVFLRDQKVGRIDFSCQYL